MKRWEDLAGRLVRAIEMIAAALAPPPEDGAVKPGSSPEAPLDEDAVERIARLEQIQRLRDHHAGILLKKLKNVDHDDMPMECDHGNAANSCNLCTGVDRANVDRDGRFRLGDAIVGRNGGVAVGPHAVARPAASECPHGRIGVDATSNCPLCLYGYRPAGVHLRPKLEKSGMDETKAEAFDGGVTVTSTPSHGGEARMGDEHAAT